MVINPAAVILLENAFNQYPMSLYNTSIDVVSDLTRKENYHTKYIYQAVHSWSSVTFSYWALLSVAGSYLNLHILVVCVTVSISNTSSRENLLLVPGWAVLHESWLNAVSCVCML